MAPWLFIVPGIYEGPGAFAPLVQSLRAAGYENIHTTQLVSTGCDINNKPLPTMGDDIAAIARDLTEVVDKAGSDGVVTLLHSAAGFLGSAAMKGLTAPARTAAGVRLPPGSGVRQIIFLAAGVMPEGAKHTPQPFMVFDESAGIQRCRDPLDNLFHDLPPAEAERWVATIQHQPGRSWDQAAHFCGWREVPSVFILAEQDRMLPASVQEKCAGFVGSKALIRVDAGHMLQLSRTDEVAKIIRSVLDEHTSRPSKL